MRLATWNVNSVRARAERLEGFLRRHEPDVVCLQELKVAESDFPDDMILRLGYRSAVFGQKTYNGVAILSKEPLDHVEQGLPGDPADDQARLIAATVHGIRVVSCYVPNGKTVGSGHWAYKLAWLGRLRDWIASTVAPDRPFAIAGDFNVAPELRDIARPAEWQDTVLTHEEARAALRAVLEAGRLMDAVRLYHEGPGPFTWWDYRMLGFPKGNGLRIDHVFLTPALASRCTGAWVDRDERKGKLPSDHAPLIVELSP